MSRKYKRPRPKKSKLPMVIFGSGLIIFSIFMLFVFSNQTGKTDTSSIQQRGSYVVPISVAYPAPDLTLENVNGRLESLKDYGGQVVLVNNWATWCPPCKAEMPTLVGFFNDHSGEGLEVIAIEAGEPKDYVLQFVEEFSLPFSVWLDPNSMALDAFNNPNLPSSYVIDRKGIIRYTWTGEINREMLEKYVTPLLSE
jgi:peroxiredoxin